MNNIGRPPQRPAVIPPPPVSTPTVSTPTVSAPPVSATPVLATPGPAPVVSTPTEPAMSAALVPTIFHEPWWLNIVSRGNYEEIQEIADGRCVGRLPYVLSRRYGMTIIGMPTLTHILGPAIDEGAGTETTRCIKRITIGKALVARLPKHACLWIKFHRDTTDTLAFQAAGFLNGVQFTSEIGPGPEAAQWSGMRDTARRVIRRAGERLRVVDLADPERFMAFYDSNLRARGVRNHYDSRLCEATIAECLRRDAGRIAVAVDDKGQLQAGVVTVWDRRTAYYLMTTRTPQADNGAISLLIWDAIKHASGKGLSYDLDGFNNAGDIQFFTRFGGRIVPRYFIEKVSIPYRIASRIPGLR